MSHQPPPNSGEIRDIPRRKFVSRFLAFTVGGLLGLLPTIPAVLFFLDPLTRKRRAVGMSGDAIDSQGYIKVASAEQLGPTPKYVKVIADLQDFWNKFPDSEVGAVYLSKDEQGTITCFNARCPHLGCTIKFQEGQQNFVCPCHASAFSLSGQRANNIPPRNMDTLEWKTDGDGMVWVKFQKFRAGIHEKVPV